MYPGSGNKIRISEETLVEHPLWAGGVERPGGPFSDFFAHSLLSLLPGVRVAFWVRLVPSWA